MWSVVRSAFHTGTSPARTRAQSFGEPVGELDDLADVVATGVQRPAQQRGEFHDREVADQGCAGAGDREAGVQAAFGQGGDVGGVVGNGVLAGPFGDLADGGDLLIGDDRTAVADLGEQLLGPGGTADRRDDLGPPRWR